ncbi:MAG TPA: hypothetical protein VFA66_01105 [Gaiellaceae bacterium]|nr:hypothetical protein [Gaiellaceae bacterium]
MASAAERFVLLGLRLGRLEDGLVDSYCGPEDLARQVETELLSDPAALAADADALLGDLEDGWLRDQVQGLRTYAGVLAGEELSYSDEVERCYGVRPERVSTDVYAEAHERLAALVPGAGSLAERYAEWRRSLAVPRDRIAPVLRDVTEVLRERTRALVELPEGEDLEIGPVEDEPWWAFNHYRGGLRSRVEVNVDLPASAGDLVEIAAHEAYPGHHTERAVKEQRLIREAGMLEESIQLVPTPASLIAEGIAEVGPAVVMDDDLVGRLEAALRRHGLTEDLKRARAVREARRPLRRVLLDAALLLHEDGGSPEDARAYLERWALTSPEEAAHGVRFLFDPNSRAYAITYSAGDELCRAWVDGDSHRFARLLGEPIRVRDLLAGVSSGS